MRIGCQCRGQFRSSQGGKGKEEMVLERFALTLAMTLLEVSGFVKEKSGARKS